MATNAQTNLTNRQYYAAHLPLGPVEGWFKHAVTTGKPTPPDASSLTGSDITDFAAWYSTRENGGQASGFIAPSYSAATQAMIALYETYFASASYIAWAHDDLISRRIQWRLRHADILDAVEQGGVVPVSADPTGAGQNAPTFPIVGSSGSVTGSNQVDTFNSGSGTDVIPSGATSLVVEVWAGGGGGARHASTPHGGGAGSYAKKTIAIAAADWGSTIAYAVGSGGPGRASTPGSGSAGNNSTVGSTTITAGTINITTHGGSGGTSSVGTGGTAGTGGDINTAGGSSSAILVGGNAPSGGGLGGDEEPGNSPGGGGGGGLDGNPENGYAGAAGRVKFTWTF